MGPTAVLILKWAAAALILLALLYGGLVAIGAWRWKAATRVLVTRLDAAEVADGALRHDARDIADLPAPVRRYLGRVLTDGQPMIRSVDLELSGLFNLSLDEPQWKPFTSTQHVVANRPGFVWSGRIAMFPGVPVCVHDAYVAGTGVLRPALFGLFSLGTVQGEGEIARGELMRWLAESVWYPTVLLPGQGITWQAVDDTSAQATLIDGPNTLTMVFRFGEDGLVTGIRVEARGALVGGETVMMPWEGRFGDYRLQAGMMLPFRGEVSWITPQGERPYFRGTVMRVDYRFATQETRTP
ncbi:MAG: hypothetical protein HLUCCA08_17025 [Rhodobacteraceae bacterium HLUCCA08]|nr:MAG: hypothetical protein HLUCCA08_17025 [Rhodobacteraceae bacterium HLUCCA08]